MTVQALQEQIQLPRRAFALGAPDYRRRMQALVALVEDAAAKGARIVRLGRGFDGFASFSEKRGVMMQNRWAATSLFHPPYGKCSRLFIDLLLRLAKR